MLVTYSFFHNLYETCWCGTLWGRKRTIFMWRLIKSIHNAPKKIGFIKAEITGSNEELLIVVPTTTSPSFFSKWRPSPYKILKNILCFMSTLLLWPRSGVGGFLFLDWALISNDKSWSLLSFSFNYVYFHAYWLVDLTYLPVLAYAHMLQCYCWFDTCWCLVCSLHLWLLITLWKHVAPKPSNPNK